MVYGFEFDDDDDDDDIFVCFSLAQSDHPPLQPIPQPGQGRERCSQVHTLTLTDKNCTLTGITDQETRGRTDDISVSSTHDKV